MYNWHHHVRELGDDCVPLVKANRDFFEKESKIRAKWWRWVFRRERLQRPTPSYGMPTWSNFSRSILALEKGHFFRATTSERSEPGTIWWG